jgi:formylmethanofuran dehydrogenase subunit E
MAMADRPEFDAGLQYPGSAPAEAHGPLAATTATVGPSVERDLAQATRPAGPGHPGTPDADGGAQGGARDGEGLAVWRRTRSPAASPALQASLERLSGLHRQLCPRQVLGVRIGLFAAEALGVEVPDRTKRLFVFVETDGCFSDGVTAATGCSLGRRTLRLVDYGKVAATFVDTLTGAAIRVWPDPCARSRAALLCPDAPSHWHAQLIGYQRMPTAELLRAARVTLQLPLGALISRPGVRVTCAACGEEVINEREVRLSGQTFCRSCVGSSYYSLEMDATPRPGTDLPLRLPVEPGLVHQA